MNFPIFSFMSCMAVLALPLAGGAQTDAAPASGDVIFSTGIKVVNVLATVETRKGEILHDLNRDDFTISEDHRPQTIRYFARQSDLPLTIGLMVDTSMSQGRVMDAERGASMRFLEQIFRETKDRLFLMQFDMSVMTRQPLTSSLKPIYNVLPYVDTPTRKELEQSNTSAGTLLYDAVVKASNEIMKPLEGRKALIIMSDGVDVGSEASLNDAVEAAEKADTLIYSIEFSDATYYGGFGGGGSVGKHALMKLAEDTGGGYFEVGKKLTIEQIYSTIETELRNQYSIGYVSDKPCTISEFRKIQLVTRQKGLVVQARTQYWARP